MAKRIDAAAAAWLAEHTHIVLVTLRRDGSPQTSNVSAHFDGSAFRVSVTAERAKTRNLARDPRAVVHVLDDSFWRYASVPCRAELGAMTSAPGDRAGQELLALYKTLADVPHPDPAEFFRDMVEQKRLVLTLYPDSITGTGW